MSTKHTPWIAKPDPLTVGEYWISDAEGTTVASGFLSKERAELCACAPELLEALDSIRIYAADTLSGPMAEVPDMAAWYRDGVRELLHRARAAISKAQQS